MKTKFDTTYVFQEGINYLLTYNFKQKLKTISSKTGATL